MTTVSPIVVADADLLEALSNDGFDPPPVTSLQELYAGYVLWCHRRAKPVCGTKSFAMRLARTFMPVRLPDGLLGFVGISLKGGNLEWGKMQ